LLLVIGAPIAALFALILLVVVVLGGDDSSGLPSGCAATDPAVGSTAAAATDKTVAGYGPEQLAGAAQVIRAGADKHMSVRDQTIAVMTAMGESGLRVLNYGDAAGPDSRGLFQQRDSWGTLAQRMDPYESATLFYNALEQVTGRDTLTPTIAAHRVQRNADPFYYSKYWGAAVQVVAALTGQDAAVQNVADTQGAPANCTLDAGPADTAVLATANAQGWVSPAAGPVTSSYGMRVNPVTGIYKLHSGTDLGADGCGGRVVAAHDGVVTFAGMDPYGTGTITVDDGGGIVNMYLHEYQSGILVRVGQHVSAGQQIATTGSTGNSTGCHLHYEVHVNGQTVDPVTFMRQVGAPIG